jgi:hypothetical protein
MEYIYKNKNGEKLTLSFPIGQAPSKTKVNKIEYERDLETELLGQSFILKGGGWPSQTYKRNEQMTKNNDDAGRRMKSTWGESSKLVPNYKGQVCESWTEANNLAQKDKE